MIDNKDQILSEVLKKAEVLTAGLNSEIRPVAYSKAVDYLLSGQAGYAPQTIETESRIGDKSTDKKEDKNTNPLSLIAENLGVTEAQVRAIYRILKGGGLEVVTKLDEEGNSAQQVQLAYIYLYGYKVGFDKDYIPSRQFAKQAATHGIRDGNISRNLDLEKKKILQSGRGNSKQYGLSPAGEEEAKSILHEMIV